MVFPLTARAQSSDLASRELRLEIKEAEDRAGDRIREIQRRVESLEFILRILGISIVGFVPAFWLIFRKTRKRVEERVGTVIESRPRALLALLDERDAGLKLRRETAILVVAETLETEGLLRASGFAQVITRSPTDITERMDRTSVVIFDLDSGCSEQTASELITRSSLEYFLVYTSGPGRSIIRGKGGTFANSPVTLFGRLTELIVYKAAVERELRKL